MMSLPYHLGLFLSGVDYAFGFSASDEGAGAGVAAIKVGFASSFSFFYLNLLNAYSTIYYVNPFLLKKIFFCVSEIRSTSLPVRKIVAIEISFYLYSSFFKSYYSFCFFLASLFPIGKCYKNI